MSESDVIENFHGVYLLKCLNAKYLGRTYIGYTVDPNRRIKQHNKGRLYGGACMTSKRGPWEMVLTVHGFPSDVSALRFEWAWQHPQRSRRLKHVLPKKKATESSFDYRLKIMFTMLRTAPWCRLPLTLRWLTHDSVVEPPADLSPPVHMPIVYGPVVSKKLKSPKKGKRGKEETISENESVKLCQICYDVMDSETQLKCLNAECSAEWHITCLAQKFLNEELDSLISFGSQRAKQIQTNILPVEGSCSECHVIMLWGDLIRKKKGCYKELEKLQPSP